MGRKRFAHYFDTKSFLENNRSFLGSTIFSASLNFIGPITASSGLVIKTPRSGTGPHCALTITASEGSSATANAIHIWTTGSNVGSNIGINSTAPPGSIYLFFDATDTTLKYKFGNTIYKISSSAQTNSLHIGMSGQSNASGSGGDPAISITQPYSNVRIFGNGVIEPLIEKTFETPLSAMCNWITWHRGDRCVANNWSKGASDFSQLREGTAPYAEGLDSAEHATDCQKGVLCWIHGEKDDSNNLAQASYITELVQLQQDWQQDISASNRAGIPPTIPLLIDQLANWSEYAADFKPSSSIAIAQLDAGLTKSNIYLVGPTYHLNWVPSDAHHSNFGHRRNGEYFGKVYDKILNGESWKPLYMTTASANANTITVQIGGGDGSNIVADTTNMIARNNYGFEYYDQNQRSAHIISASANKSDREVSLFLNRAPSSTGRVRYAWTTGREARIGITGSGPGGNIRDMDASPSRVGDDNLWNWLVVQDLAISSFTGGGTTGPTYSPSGSLELLISSYLQTPIYDALDNNVRATWSWWVRRDSSWVGSELAMLSKNVASLRQFDFRGLATNQGRFYIARTISSLAQFDLGSAPFSGNNWFNIVCVFNGDLPATDRFAVYVNSSSISGTISSDTLPSALVAGSTVELRIGNVSNGIGNGFGTANFRDFAIWNNFAASASHISEIYNSGALKDLRSASFGAPTNYWILQRDTADYGTGTPQHMVLFGTGTFEKTVFPI